MKISIVVLGFLILIFIHFNNKYEFSWPMSERDGGIGGDDGDDDVFDIISVDFFFSIILKSDQYVDGSTC